MTLTGTHGGRLNIDLGKPNVKAKILVIDDESSILHALEIFLGHEGYEVQAQDKYDSALEKVDREDLPQLIILDILLAEEDGRVISRKLKDNPKTKNIPILLISAHPTGYKAARHSGADAFLSKPFSPSVLLETIDHLCES